MWRELIRTLEPAAQLVSGASKTQLLELERTFHLTLPADLKTLLGESNGVRDAYGFCLIWSTEEIARYKQEMRTLSQYNTYDPFIDFFFFADAGNGDRFAFPLHEGKVDSSIVLAWDHEDDRRRPVASSLQSYLEGWLRGEISV